MTATKCSKCGGWVAKRGEWIEVDSVHDVPKRCSCDDTLTFAEAMALDPSEVEVWAKGGWEPLERGPDHPTGDWVLSFLRVAKFRRSRPKRSRVEEMALQGPDGLPCAPDRFSIIRAEAMTEAIRTVSSELRRRRSGAAADIDAANWVEREFLEKR